ncbi:hypothetical protein [Mycolicibacterium iranicum]|uniref:Uncharacterized protein n=1 Tax=Mycolicibacterium iranicum TaxID=912594 RepID=A0A178LZG0_MYCIR|nr:hypothetical protein [Mycolicibacterium iranicum]OAN40344.1 hypothetical protein A4X20_14585 [Mycolicibacterium iranicum]
METWGWNPATLEASATAVAAVFAIIAVVVAWRTFSATSSEIGSRMRPWVGLYGFEFFRDESGTLRVGVLLRNCGPLPALQAHLVVDFEPGEKESLDEVVIPARVEKFEEKALMPAEDGNYGYPLSRETYPQLETWIAAKRDIVAKGSFSYALGDRAFESMFQAELWFKSRPIPEGKLVKVNWRNTSAT